MLLRYLFGQADAIRQVASARTGWPLGVLLVLLTAIPRNYDQTFLGEKPFLWLFGPLLFSLVSGFLLFAFLQVFVLGRRVPRDQPRTLHQWASFMGLFWLTAPIAWLYAIPVERFLDSLTATRMNLALLGLVALWRVLLMARVLNVVNAAPFFHSLVWVLVPAAMEVLAVVIFGGTFSKQLMASMGGMRNSPEEELILAALGGVFSITLFSLPVLMILGAVLLARMDPVLKPFPAPGSTRTPWLFLVLCLVGWVAVAIPAQRQVRRNVVVEHLVEEGQFRAALNYLAARQPTDFAPSRPLPPKAYEREVFTQLPGLFAEIRTNDPPWVQAHLMQRLRQICSHYGPKRREEVAWSKMSDEKLREELTQNLYLANHNLGGIEWLQLLNGVERTAEGRDWLSTNGVFLRALTNLAAEPRLRNSSDDGEAQQMKDWQQLAKRIRDFLPAASATNAPRSTPP